MVNPYKVQAVATLLGTSPDSVRRYVEESGIDVKRQESGPRTRQFTLENIYDLANWRRINRPKYSLQKKIIMTIYAPKGGVGKTTTASNLSCIFPLMGLRTLVVDLDFQANLTLSFGYETELTAEDAKEEGIPADRIIDAHLGDLIPGWPSGRRKLSDVLKKPYGENGPHLIPADLTLDRLDTLLTFDAIEGKRADMKIASVIAEGLSGKNPDIDMSGYDVIIFDAAPAKNRITRGALLSSDFVISPVSLEKYSTKAVSYLATVLTEMRTEYGKSPELLIFGNFKTPNRLRIPPQVEFLSKKYPGALLEESIRRSEEFPKTLSSEEIDMPPVALAKPSCDPSVELRAIAESLLLKMGVINA